MGAKLNNGGRNTEMEVHSECGKISESYTNCDTVSARTQCVEHGHLMVGPRGPITKAANQRNITRKNMRSITMEIQTQCMTSSARKS